MKETEHARSRFDGETAGLVILARLIARQMLIARNDCGCQADKLNENEGSKTGKTALKTECDFYADQE